MKKLLQINLSVNCLSTGKIAEDIGKAAMQKGWESYIAGKMIGKNPSESSVIKIGNSKSLYFPYFESFLLDNHCFGLASRSATRKLIDEIERIKPDVIQLHTIHCYYLNLKLLFEYFATIKAPIVWTLHDCWSFTGHCAHFDAVGCDRWKTHCLNCPQLKLYPKSLGLIDNSWNNFDLKKKLFTSLGDRLHIITVSQWLLNLAKKSFFNGLSTDVIYNGVNTNIYKPNPSNSIRSTLGLDNKKILLGVASSWSERKGLNDYLALSKILSDDKRIILIGLKKKQIKNLPPNIIGIEKTEIVYQLTQLYSIASVVLNLSIEETFGLTTVEGMACGTPGIVYDKTASPELITPETGYIVKAHDIQSLKESIESIIEKGKSYYSQKCIDRVQTFFNAEKQCSKYINLYNSINNRII